MKMILGAVLSMGRPFSCGIIKSIISETIREKISMHTGSMGKGDRYDIL